MWAWQAAGQVNIIPSYLWVSGGYSTVRVERHNGYFADNQYKRGSYIFGNVFLQLTDNCRLALEYLHGMQVIQEHLHKLVNLNGFHLVLK